jgi:hypothetical protein
MQHIEFYILANVRPEIGQVSLVIENEKILLHDAKKLADGTI